MLLEALENSHLFSVCHLLTAQYVSVCQEILLDTELLNVVLLFVKAKEWSILTLLIRHESCYYRIVYLFLDNLGQRLYVVSLAHDIGNFVEGINCSLVLIFNAGCWEVSLNKKRTFRCEFMYILWIELYLKNERIQRSNKIMHICFNIYYPLFFSYLREYEIWSFIMQITHVRLWENSTLVLRAMLSDPISLFFLHFMSFLWNSFFP
jgi:hypothetical protein